MSGFGHFPALIAENLDDPNPDIPNAVRAVCRDVREHHPRPARFGAKGADWDWPVAGSVGPLGNGAFWRYLALIGTGDGAVQHPPCQA